MLDSQNRFVIPETLRELVGFDPTKKYAICPDDDLIFQLVETSQIKSELIVEVASCDEKSRVWLTKRFCKRYHLIPGMEELVFVQDGKLYVSFVQDDFSTSE